MATMQVLSEMIISNESNILTSRVLSHFNRSRQLLFTIKLRYKDLEKVILNWQGILARHSARHIQQLSGWSDIFTSSLRTAILLLQAQTGLDCQPFLLDPCAAWLAHNACKCSKLRKQHVCCCQVRIPLPQHTCLVALKSSLPICWQQHSCSLLSGGASG